MSLEVYPVISVHSRLGGDVSSVDVDYEQLVNYMQERGLTDDQIANTFITISAHSGLRDGDYSEDSGNSVVHAANRLKKNTKGTIDLSDALASALEPSIRETQLKQPSAGELARQSAVKALGAGAVLLAVSSAQRMIEQRITRDGSFTDHLLRHGAVSVANRIIKSETIQSFVDANDPDRVASNKAAKNAPKGLLTITRR